MTHANRPRLPRMVRFLAVNAAAGALVGGLAAVGMLATDAGGIASLASASGSLPTAPFMLIGGFALTFASLAMGSAIMLMSRGD